MNQTDLVISKVELDVQGLQIRQHLANRGVEVDQCKLLTTREDASFLTYKVRVKNSDAEKLKDPLLWPEGTEIRPYNQAKKKSNVRDNRAIARNGGKGLNSRNDAVSQRPDNVGNAAPATGTQQRNVQPLNLLNSNNLHPIDANITPPNNQHDIRQQVSFMRNDNPPMINNSLINPLGASAAGRSNGMQRSYVHPDNVLFEEDLPRFLNHRNLAVGIPHTRSAIPSNQWRDIVQQGYVSPGNSPYGSVSSGNVLYNPLATDPRNQVRILDRLDNNTYAQS